MHSCSASESRRCRPLLGTFVEITVPGGTASIDEPAIHAAFETIESLQRRLNVHDPDSELSRLNRFAARHPVSVSAPLADVLGKALELSETSRGAFDPTVGSLLASWTLRPAWLKRPARGDWRDVAVLPDQRVVFHRPVALDLGGIAKGYAVDAAVDELVRRGVRAGIVNAGGDLRVFGEESIPVHVRHPRSPGRFVHLLELKSGAIATSSPCFTEQTVRGRRVSHLVHGRSRRPILGPVSVSVLAPACWLADALTKVVLGAGAAADESLARYGAQAQVLSA